MFKDTAEIREAIGLPIKGKPGIRVAIENKLWFIPWMVTSYVLWKILRGKI